jgi:hypothetical protein
MSAAEGRRDAFLRGVSARNDRFLTDFVERHEACPFARPCREQGKLWRAVSFATLAEDAVARALSLLAAADDAATAGAGPEVALLVMPGLAHLPPAAFDAVHAAIRDAYERRADPRYYVVAFHPGYATNARTPAALVRFFRRSPEPTLQLVARAVLAPLRHSGDEAERVRLAGELIAAGADAETLERALRPPRDVSRRVGENNAARFAALGEDALASTLRALCAEAAAAREVIACDADWADASWTVVGAAEG